MGLILFAFGVAPPPVQASELTKDDLKVLAISIATAHNLHVSHFLKVIECESHWNMNARGDGGHSIGLVQINLPSHPQVTEADALNPYFALPWMAEQWQNDNYRAWSCWSQLNRQGWPGG